MNGLSMNNSKLKENLKCHIKPQGVSKSEQIWYHSVLKLLADIVMKFSVHLHI